MATIIETGIDTDGISLPVGDDLIIMPTGQVSDNLYGVFGSGADHEIQILGSVAGGNSGIFLSATGGVTHEILVAANGSISGASFGIVLSGDGGDIANAGSIVGGTGVRSEDNSVLLNTGSITANSFGVDFGANALIANTGEIAARFYGIFVEDGDISNSGDIIQINSGANNTTKYSGVRGSDASGTLSLSNTGTIIGQEFGVSAAGELILNNSGEITGGDNTAVEAYNGAIITNTGSILAENLAIFSASQSTNLELSNEGSIVSSKATAIYSQFGANVVNNGEILSTDGDGLLASGDVGFVNSGRISASDSGLDVLGNLDLVNSGTISGATQSSFAVSLIEVTGNLLVQNTGVMTSASVLFDRSVTTNATTDIQNSGTLMAQAEIVQSVRGNIEIENSGEIISGWIAIDANGIGYANLQNTGIVAADNDIINTTDGVALLFNDGVVNAGNDVLEKQGGTGNATILNNGSITAQTFLIRNTQGDAILENNGQINSGSGIFNQSSFTSNATITNTDTMDISFGQLVFSNGSININNSGSLSSVGLAGQAADGATLINNSGNILSTGTLAVVNNGAVTIFNSGAITTDSGVSAGAGFAFVDLRNTGTFDSGNGALVSTQGDVVFRNGQDGQVFSYVDDTVSSIPLGGTQMVSGGTVIVRNDGAVDSGADGFNASTRLDLSNTGSMTAATDLAVLNSGQTASIRNSGEMMAGQYLVTTNNAGANIVNSETGQMFAQTLFNSFESGFVSLTNQGSISTTQDLINHSGFSGGVQINNIGSISNGGFGATVTTYLNDVSFRNQGELLSTSGLVSTDEGNINFWNTGTVTAQSGLEVNVSSGNIVLRNDGDMVIETGAVANTSGTVIFSNTGTLRGSLVTGDMISGGNVSVSNSGSIIAEGLSLNALFDGANIDLSNSGSITSSGAIVSGSSSSTTAPFITNSGTIQSGANLFDLSVPAQSAGLVNTGSIIVSGNVIDEAIIFNFQNTGSMTVDGAIASLGSGTFRNTGDIVTGSGVTLTSGLDSTSASLPTFHNSGSLTATSGPILDSVSSRAMTAYNSGDLASIGSGAMFQVAGNFVMRNDGMMTGQDGISSSGDNLTFTNTGVLSVENFVISHGGSGLLEVRNTGDIAAGFKAINTGSDVFLRLSNSGTIEGEVNAFDARITNSGTILTNDGSDIAAVRASNNSTLINSGEIFAAQISAVDGNFRVLSNGQNGVIQGVQGVNMGGVVDGVLINNGLIVGVGTDTSPTGTSPVAAVNSSSSANSKLVNHGTISGADHGILMRGANDANTIVNTGTISGAFSEAIEISNTGGATTYGHTIKNLGTISGDVALSEGADLFDGRGGEVDGVVLLGGGNDVGRGGDLADIFDGGAGDDDIFGGLGDDQLTGGDGRDELFGQDGNDLLIGGLGNDILQGNDGDDVLQGEDGNDTLNGGRGDDNLQGGDGNDRLFGRDGVDNMSGGLGDDFMDGGDGDDRFVGSGGNDRIEGGDGIDVAVYTGAEADYTIQVLSNGALRITDNRNSAQDGVDVLTNVELLNFSDGIVDVAGL